MTAKDGTNRGRPLKFKDPVELQHKIDAYFEYCDNLVMVNKEGDEVPTPQPYTISGLARCLDVDTETLRNYENRDEFFATIKQAKQRVEEYLETRLYGQAVTGVIFNLKNNFKWKDKHETEHSGQIGYVITEGEEED